MNIVELNTTLVEENIAYQEKHDIDDIEITPLAKMLTGILTRNSTDNTEKRDISVTTNAQSVEKEEYDIEITPLAKMLTGILGTQEELIQAIKDSDEEDWRKEYHLHFLEKHSKHLNESIY